MRSTVELAVEATRTGGTRVVRLRHEGAVAARITGTGAVATVHLVGAAAGPMAGDAVTVRVSVGPGATLRLRSVAAAVVLPGAEPGASAAVDIELDLDEDADLDLELQPTIVTARARLSQRTSVTAHAAARLRLREHLVGGRHDEAGGAWAAGLDVRRGPRPVLRQRMTHRTAPARVLTTGVDLWPVATAPAPRDDHAWGEAACAAVTCSLAAGGCATTAWGPDLTSARRALDHLSHNPG